LNNDISETSDIGMWSYLLAGVAVLFGLLLLYTFCLRAAENDWTVDERTPPGPLHLPLIGSLTSVLGASQVGPWLDSLITTHGDVVRCCVPGQKIVLVREAPAKREGKENSDANRGESLDRRSLLDVTLNHLVGLVRKLGAKVDLTEVQVERCAQLARSFYNFTVTVEDFALLMQSAENYRVALHQKKVMSMIGELLKREVGLGEPGKNPLGEQPEKVALGEPEKDLLESALTQMDKFREEVARSSPALWLPLTCHFPSFFFERKRLSKSMAHLTHLLSQVFQSCGGNPESCDFEQFLLIYLAIGLSTTSPSRKPSKPRLPNPDRSRDSAAVTIESSSSESFDIIGLRFFSSLDYVNVGHFDIPGNSLIVTSARPLSG